MSKYDNYVKRMKRLYNTKLFFYRFRNLFAFVFAIICFVIFSFCSYQGDITGTLELKSTNIMYGEDYFVDESSIKVFASNYVIEYCSENNNVWTEQKPTKPGYYKLRAKSHNAFGTPKYSNEVDLYISKRMVEVNFVYDENKIYNYSEIKNFQISLTNSHDENSNALVKGDYIDSFNYFYDGLGTVNYDNKSTIKARLTFHKLGYDVIIKNDQGNVVNSLYEFRYNDATINVQKAPLNYSIDFNTNVEYNNLNLSIDDFKFNYNQEDLIFNESLTLLEDRFIKFEKDNETYIKFYPVEVGQYDVKLNSPNENIIITDYDKVSGFEIDVSKFYYLENNSLSNYINILPRKIYLKPVDKELTFDNQGHTFDNYEYCSISKDDVNHQFIDEDYIKLLITYSFDDKKVKSSGEHQGYISSFESIYSQYDNIKNYDIDISTPGILKINKLKINLKTFVINNNEHLIYDGSIYEYKSFFNEEDDLFEYVEGSNVFFDEDVNSINIRFFYILNNQEVICKNANEENYILSYEIDECNYEINIDTSSSSLKIDKRKVNIETLNVDSIIYDGENHEYNSFFDGINKYQYSQDSLYEFVEGENYKLEVYYTLNENEIRPNNVGKYILKYRDSKQDFSMDNYELTVNTINSSLDINKRKISLITNQVDSIIYDGKIHEYNSFFKDETLYSYQEDSLEFVNGYILDISFYYALEGRNPRNVGIYELNYILSSDLTNYEIKINCDPSILEITKRTIYISPKNVEEEYDGTNHEFNNNEYDYAYNSINDSLYQFIEEDNIVLTNLNFDYENEERINVGLYYGKINGFSSNNELINNYVINIENHNYLTILKRKIRIKTLEVPQITYEGNIHYYEEFFNKDEPLYVIANGSNDFVEGERLNITFFYTLDNQEVDAKNVGTYILSYTINGIDNGDLNNYEIYVDCKDSSLIINKRIIYIKPVDAYFVYDGENHYFEDWKYYGVSLDNEENQFVDYDLNLLIINYIYEEQERINVKENGYLGTIGSIDFEEKDLKNNYEIISENGLITINKRKISLITNIVDSIIYDGKIHEYNSFFEDETLYSYQEDSLEFVKGESLNIIFFYTLNNEKVDAKNVGDYYLSYTINGIDNGDINNYQIYIDCKDSSLTINKREVSIETLNVDSITYDGENHEYNSFFNGINKYQYSEDSLYEFVEGEDYHLEVYYTLKGNEIRPNNVGTYILYFRNSEQDFLMDNYELKVDTSKSNLIIKERKIYINTLNVGSIAYDGKIHEYQEFFEGKDLFVHTNESEGFVKEQSLDISFFFTDIYGNKINARNVGIYYLSYIINGINNGDLNNYEIEINCDFSILEITKRTIYISPKNVEEEYDGENHYFKDYDYVSSSINNSLYQFIKEDNIVLTNLNFDYEDEERINVGNYKGTIISYNCENEMINNYNIDFSSDNKLVIYPRKISIKTSKVSEIIYDGNIHYYEDLINDDEMLYEHTSESHYFVKGHELIFTFFYTFNNEEVDAKNVGTYILSYAISEYNQGDLNNYEVIVDTSSSSLIINKREVYIETLKVGSIIYDGNIHEYNSFFENNEKLYSYQDSSLEFVEGEKLNITFFYTLDNQKVDAKNVGTYILLYTINGIDNGDLNNYEIYVDCEDSSLIINKRIIYIKPVDAYFVYDGENHYFEYWEYYGVSLDNEENQFVDYDLNLLIINYIYDEQERINVKENGYLGTIGSIDFEEKDLKNNYEIISENGLITINKRKISLITNQVDSIIYDGNIHEYNSFFEENEKLYSYQNNSLEFVNSYILDISFYYKLEGTSPRNVGIYELNYIISSDLTNYEIEINCDPSILEITKRNIYISPKYIEEEYDGENHYFKDYDYVSFSINNPLHQFIKEDNIVLTNLNFDYENEERINVGSYKGIIVSYNCENEMINNYNIDFSSDNKLVIYLRKISIKTSKVSEIIYDGNIHYYEDLVNKDDSLYVHTNLSSGFLENRELDISFFYTLNGNEVDAKNVGTYVLYYVINGINNDDINNYDIEVDTSLSNLIINKRKVRIETLKIESITYDGENHEYNSFFNGINKYQYSEGSLEFVEGEDYKLEVYYTLDENEISPINVGTYILFFRDSDQDFLMDNYELTVDTSKSNLIIKKRIVTILISSLDNFDYDGEYHSYWNDSLNNYEKIDNLLSIHQIKLKIGYIKDNIKDLEIKDVGTYIPYLDDYSIYEDNIENKSLKDNYIIKIDYENKTIINPCLIKVPFVSLSATYDSNIYAFEQYEYLLPTKEGSYLVNVSSSYQFKEAGSYKFIFDIENISLILNEGIKSSLDNYKFENEGESTLDISKCLIIITPEEYEVTFNKEYIDVNKLNIKSDYSLCENDTIESLNLIFGYKAYDEEGNLPYNAGTYILEVSVTGNDYFNRNYEVNYLNSDLIIKKRAYSILLNYEDSKIYDGLYYSYDNGIDGNNNTINDQSTDKYLNEIIYLNIIFMDEDLNEYEEVISSKKYNLKLNGYQIDGIDNNQNYEISLDQDYYYEILQRDIEIRNKDDQVTYSGLTYPLEEQLSIDNLIISDIDNEFLNKISNKIISLNKSSRYFDKTGIYSYHILVTLVDLENNDVSENYNIKYIEGKFEILKKEMIINILPLETKIYDGKSYSLNDTIIENIKEQVINQLVERDSSSLDEDGIIISLKKNYINPGNYSDYSNKLISHIYISNVNYIDNYEIIYNEENELTIIKNKISYKDNDYEFIYNNEIFDINNNLDDLLVYETDCEASSYYISKYYIYDYDTNELINSFNVSKGYSSSLDENKIKNARRYKIVYSSLDVLINSGEGNQYYDIEERDVILLINVNKVKVNNSKNNFITTSSKSIALVNFDDLEQKYTSASIKEYQLYYDNFEDIELKIDSSKGEVPYVWINKTSEKNDLRHLFTLILDGEDVTNNFDLESDISYNVGTLNLSVDFIFVNRDIEFASLNYDLKDTNKLYIKPKESDQLIGNAYLNITIECIFKDDQEIFYVDDIGTYRFYFTIDSICINGINYEDISNFNFEYKETVGNKEYYYFDYTVNQSTIYLKPYVDGENKIYYEGKEISLDNNDYEIVYGFLKSNYKIEFIFEGTIGSFNEKNELITSVTPTIVQAIIKDENDIIRGYYSPYKEEIDYPYIIKTSYDEYLKAFDEESIEEGNYDNLFKSRYKQNIKLKFSYRYVIYENSSCEFEYDGKYHSYQEGTRLLFYEEALKNSNLEFEEKNYGLLEGNTYVAYNFKEVNRYNENGFSNTCSFKVYDQEGRDISNAFKFSYSENGGKLFINKKNLTVKSISLTLNNATIDESELHQIESSIGLIDGDKIVLESIEWVDINEAISEKKNIFVIKKIVNSYGNNVTNNYNIIYEYGDLL